ncbi:MAG TPA: carboxymuconolactone decarboxylase family protein [Aldersonia sp.]
MPRIPAVTPEQAGPLTRAMYWFARRRFGEVPEPFAVLANHRKLIVAEGIAELAAQAASKTLPANIREIAVYRTAWTVGCSWCIDFGTMIQRLDGLDVERLRDIADYETSPHYNADERAAIAYADAMTSTPIDVTDEQVADLERRFGRAGVIELTYQIALENLRSRQNAALGITDQGFSTEACRVPWAESMPSAAPAPARGSARRRPS